MSTNPRLRRVGLAALLALSPLLAGCATPAPGSPEEQALQHQYQTGCRAVDAQGYEKLLQYCGHDGGGGKN
ncbi:MAG TPA: hypothetical protein VLX09_13375 [Stellaceae bacterium]|nr:hypothetical protein [Stellaceae bacterium]